MAVRALCICFTVLVVPGTRAYSALLPTGMFDDSQTSVVYYPDTGELAIDAPFDDSITSIAFTSEAGIFTGEVAVNLDGPFDKVRDFQIFKAVFGGESFGSLSLGLVAPEGLTEEFLLSDLTVVGTLRSSITDPLAFGNADLIYIAVPEPSAIVITMSALFGILLVTRRHCRIGM